eukprot:582426-Prorocentrum_lima.AAC.1
MKDVAFRAKMYRGLQHSLVDWSGLLPKNSPNKGHRNRVLRLRSEYLCACCLLYTSDAADDM